MPSSTHSSWIQPLALGLAVLGCFLAGLLRVYPVEWNFAPVGALALFAGARLRWWLALALPLGVIVATDAVLAAQRPGYTFPYPGMPLVYGSFLLYVLLGRTLARTENPLRIGATTVGGSLQFYVLTNLGVWLTSAHRPGDPHSYPPTLAGLIDCYVQAIPFLARTVGSDALFAAALFGAHAWLTRLYFHEERVPGLAPAAFNQVEEPS
jgi:hypothetical protein